MTRTNATTNAAATTTTVAWIVVALVATSAGGCMTAAQAPRPRMAGDLAVSVPVALQNATVEVTVTGTDLAEPVTERFEVRNGVAEGRVDGIAAGSNRLVLITATDGSGRRCSREVSATVDALGVSELSNVELECNASAALAIAAANEQTAAFPPLF